MANRKHLQRDILLRFALSLMCVATFLAGCAQSAPVSRQTPSQTPAATATAPTGNVYTDPILGFRLTLPTGWRAISYPGHHQPTTNTLVVLEEPTPGPASITLGVFQSAGMPAAFARRGQPTERIGAYPAFSADTGLSQGKVPCLARNFLADEDYALAEWCAMDASRHASEFERILASYTPAPASFLRSAVTVSPPAQSCGKMQQDYGYKAATWGRALATANPFNPSGGWREIAGVTICSNTGSPDKYLFQCTELVNRYDAEQWGLPHIPGNAARYMDYYLNGTSHPGSIRDLPAGSFALSDDASQGTSAFAPQPGDLLVFQDVADPAHGWTSGLIASPGHIAIITGVDATHVYIAQENYNDRQYFLALPLTHTARGYAITDRSGVVGRIVRGWIHFNIMGA